MNVTPNKIAQFENSMGTNRKRLRSFLSRSKGRCPACPQWHSRHQPPHPVPMENWSRSCDRGPWERNRDRICYTPNPIHLSAKPMVVKRWYTLIPTAASFERGKPIGMETNKKIPPFRSVSCTGSRCLSPSGCRSDPFTEAMSGNRIKGTVYIRPLQPGYTFPQVVEDREGQFSIRYSESWCHHSGTVHPLQPEKHAPQLFASRRAYNEFFLDG